MSVYVNEEISRKIPQHNRGVFQIISDDYLYTKKSDIFPELTKRIKILIKRLSNLLSVEELYVDFIVHTVEGNNRQLWLQLRKYEDNWLSGFDIINHSCLSKINFCIEKRYNSHVIVLHNYKRVSIRYD